MNSKLSVQLNIDAQTFIEVFRLILIIEKDIVRNLFYSMLVSSTNSGTIFVFQLNIIKSDSQWSDRKTSKLCHILVIDLSAVNTLVEIQITSLSCFIAIFFNNRS